MGPEGNGNGAGVPRERVDYERLCSDLAMQVGTLTAEVMARGQIIDRLRGEMAERDTLILQLTEKEATDARP